MPNAKVFVSHRRRLLTDLLEDDLSEVVYDAALAGLDYSVTNYRGGILVSVNGYNDKLHVLAKDVLERTRNLKVQPDRLAVMQDQVGMSPRVVDRSYHSSSLAGQTGIRKLVAWFAIPSLELLQQVPVVRARVDSGRALGGGYM